MRHINLGTLNRRKCGIELAIHSIENGLQVSFDKSIHPNDLKQGVIFGAQYFNDHYSGGLSIVVKDIRWMPVDSRMIIATYVTVKCLSQALKYKFELIRFDETNGTFVFAR